MPERRLIVLASGWTGTKSSWYFLARRFKEMGYDCLQAVYPYRGYSAIQHSARSLAKVVDTLRSEYEHITFVGHSMGGLVGRHIIQRGNHERKLFDAYVSIGTPHQGSYYANLMPPIGEFGKSARQMKVGSEFLKRLNASEWPDDVPALAISGSWEEIVIPRSSTQFEPAEHISIPYATHVSLVLDPRTFFEIWAWLTFTIFGEGPMNHIGFASKIDIE